MTIATLIAVGNQDASIADAMVEPMARLGAVEIEWIEHLKAASLKIDAPVEDVRRALMPAPGTDLIVRPYDFSPALFLADMDSTMIGQECIDELAAVAGVGEKVAAITERAMRGELDFAGALKQRLALLEGLDARVIGHLLETRITTNPGAETLIATLKARGVRTVLVSGGFTAFADVVGKRLGFDRVVANELEIVDNKLTGRIDGAIVDGARKKTVLEEECANIDGHVIAIGDGANDLPMLDAADLGVAYHAKPKVAAAADARIDHHGLDALLYGLGIPSSDWVRAR